MDYEWDRYTSPYLFQQILEKNHDWLIQDFQTAAAEWWEKEKFQLQSEGEARAIQQLAYEEKYAEEKKEKRGNEEIFYWITVNPKITVSLKDLIKCQRKMVSKNWIQSYAYVYEITDNGHIHTHTLIKGTETPFKAERGCASTVAKICDISNKHCFNFKVIQGNDIAIQKINYLLGKKKKEKQHNMELTKKWREKESLKEIYYSEVPLPCWDLGKRILDDSENQMNPRDEK